MCPGILAWLHLLTQRSYEARTKARHAGTAPRQAGLRRHTVRNAGAHLAANRADEGVQSSQPKCETAPEMELGTKPNRTADTSCSICFDV